MFVYMSSARVILFIFNASLYLYFFIINTAYKSCIGLRFLDPMLLPLLGEPAKMWQVAICAHHLLVSRQGSTSLSLISLPIRSVLLHAFLRFNHIFWFFCRYSCPVLSLSSPVSWSSSAGLDGNRHHWLMDHPLQIPILFRILPSFPRLFQRESRKEPVSLMV